MANFKTSLKKAVWAAAETRRGMRPSQVRNLGYREGLLQQCLARLGRVFLILNREVKKKKISFEECLAFAQEVLGVSDEPQVS